MTEMARRLLRALVDEEVARRQTDREDAVVGATVTVSAVAARTAGIEADRYYHEVLSATLAQLVDEGALVYDHEASHLMAEVVGEPDAYKITPRGIELLRDAGEL